MTTVLTEFSDASINSDLELTYIKKFNTQLQPLLSLSPIIIDNQYGYGNKLNLTSVEDINCCGDYIMQNCQPYLNTYLQSIYNKSKTFYNNAMSGSDVTIDEYLRFNYNTLLNTSTSINRPNILFFGPNDIARTEDLYIVGNAFLYGQACMAAFLALLLPKDKIVYGRNFTTKSGTWTNSPLDNVGILTNTSASYIQHVFNNVRYIAVSWLNHTESGNFTTLFTVYVDGVIAAIVDENIVKFGTNPSSGYHCAILIDCGSGSIGNKTVKILHQNTANLTIIQYVCGWNPTDITQQNKQLLVCFNNNYIGGSETITNYSQKKMDLLEMVKCVVNSCYRFGLPIGFLDIPQTNFYSNIYKSWAEHIVKYGIIING